MPKQACRGHFDLFWDFGLTDRQISTIRVRMNEQQQMDVAFRTFEVKHNPIATKDKNVQLE